MILKETLLVNTSVLSKAKVDGLKRYRGIIENSKSCQSNVFLGNDGEHAEERAKPLVGC